jgi:hypothetical protein
MPETMNTCNTCKYWSSRLNIVKNISDCDRPDCKADKNITFEIEATADDDSNMNVTLLTSGNFGCILHEPKRKPSQG